MKIAHILTVSIIMAVSASGAVEIVKNSKTQYEIVTPDSSDVGNKFALAELRLFLEKASGAKFRAVPSSKAAGSKRIFLGISDAALKILKEDPRIKMEEQQHCVKTINGDLFLFGKGEWGDIYAVYDFLENVLGYRWYDARGGMKTPDCKNLSLGELNRSNNFSPVKLRSIIGYWIYHRPQAHLFLIRNRQNKAAKAYLKPSGVNIPDDQITASNPGSHTIPMYIPGKKVSTPFKWIKNKDYFKTNPEYFGLSGNTRGRYGHLCFSNKDLRKELTANILEHMRRTPHARIFSISQHDSGGRFCVCENCAALEKKYKTNGGPLIDYLLELSPVVQKKFPANLMSFLVYRKSQTQRPPDIARLPDNLIPVFAPIDDDFGKSWLHKNNADTLADFKKWCALSSKVQVWYYVNPYSGHVIRFSE